MSNAVPHGWSVQLLGKLADVRSSNVDKKSDASELPVRLCNYTDVYYRNRITSDIDFMHATAKQGEIDRFALEKGDVIITKDSETPDDIAVPALVSESLPGVICGYHLTLLRPEPDRSNGEFLAHLFQLQSVQHYFYLLANGTTRFGLTAEAINTAPLITPPLPEQQKIATILSSVDNVIEKTRAQIDKLKDLKNGMMQELLTKGIGHTEFKDSPVGRIPAAWEIARLGDIVLAKGIQTGPFGSQLHSHEYIEWGVPVIMPRDMKGNKIDPASVAHIPLEKAVELDKHRVEVGDLVFARRGDIGRFALVDKSNEGWVCGTGCLKVRLQPSVSPAFIASYLTLTPVIEWLNTNAVGQTMLNLNTSILSELPIILPPAHEQAVIGEAILSLDNKVALSSDKLDSLLRVKKALMQDLLTGKVRVNQNDSVAI